MLALYIFKNILKSKIEKRTMQRKGRLNDYVQGMCYYGVEKTVFQFVIYSCRQRFVQCYLLATILNTAFNKIT